MAGGGGHWFAVDNRHRIRNASRQFPDEAFLLEAENAAPDPVQADRDDRRLEALHDPFETAPEGQHLPDAGDLALGKNADHLAVANGLGGRPQGGDHLPRANLGGNRNGLHQAGQPSHQRLLVETLVDHEADRPVRRRLQQQGVDQGQVITDKKRPALLRNMLPSLDPDPVKGAGHYPEDKPQQGIREQPQRIYRPAEYHQRDHPEDLQRIQLQDPGQQEVNRRGHEDADKGKHVGSGDGGALLVPVRTVLDDRANRHDEEAGKKSVQPEEQGGPGDTATRQGQQRTKEGHAQRPQRNQAVLDLVAGQVSRAEAAQPDPDRDGRHQVEGDLPGIEPEQVLPVDNDRILLDQGGQEEKVGVPGNGQPQDPVVPDPHQLGPEIANKIGPPLLAGVGRWQPLDPQAGAEAKAGQTDQNDAGPPIVAAKGNEEPAAGDGPGNDGHESAQLDDPVPPGQALRGQQLRQQAVLGRAEKGALPAHQEDRQQDHPRFAEKQSQQGHAHNGDFGQLGPDHHAPLAVAVGQVAAGHGKKDERDGEQPADQRHFQLTRGPRNMRQGHPDDDEHGQGPVDIVAEGPLELGHNQRPEAPDPVLDGCSLSIVHGKQASRSTLVIQCLSCRHSGAIISIDSPGHRIILKDAPKRL
mgnify:CR=1 FL=1